MADRRLEQIVADVQTAIDQLLPSGATDPQVLSLEEEEGAVTFDVERYGEFTVFLPETYPGSCTVYGPDDFELEHQGGRLCDIIEDTLADLRSRQARKAAAKPVGSSASTALSFRTLTTSDRTATEGSTFSDILGGSEEPLLAEDIENVRALLGDGNVQQADMAHAWRVRLRVPLVPIGAPEDSEPLVSETTAVAWGMDPDKPIMLELHLPYRGYLTDSMSADCLHNLWQEDYPEFLLDKQLKLIVSEFIASKLGKKEGAIRPSSTHDMPESYCSCMQEYDEKKVCMASEAQGNTELGFLCHVVLYLQQRITTLHEYCALCDQSFGLQPMLLRTVCSRELCTHQFAEFGEKITSAEGMNTRAEIVELLVFMLFRAANSHRRQLVLDPYPCLYGGASGKERVFHPDSKDDDKLLKILEELMQVRKETGPTTGAAWTAFTNRMSPTAAALVQWCVASNHSYLAPLTAAQRISAFRTEHQYLLISAPPEKEDNFQRLKDKHGSFFAFHGSDIGNWHSILRNGLKNASNTPLMSAGASYGSGIYLAKSSQLSSSYCGASSVGGMTAPPPLVRQVTGNRFLEHAESLVMMALCEVIDHPSLKKYDWGFVAPEENTVCTRLFLAIPQRNVSTDIQLTNPVVDEIRALMLNLKVGCGSSSRRRAAEVHVATARGGVARRKGKEGAEGEDDKEAEDEWGGDDWWGADGWGDDDWGAGAWSGSSWSGSGRGSAKGKGKGKGGRKTSGKGGKAAGRKGAGKKGGAAPGSKSSSSRRRGGRG